MRDTVDSGWFDADKSRIVKTGAEIRTLNDSRAIITIDNGSSVRLDENTHIIFNDIGPDVMIAIKSGSIYNKVAKNKERQYVVHTGDYTVTALGTEFGVKRGYDSVGVMVTKSAIDFARFGGEKIDEVQEGNKIIVQDDAIIKNEIMQEDLDDGFIAWNLDGKTEEDENIRKDIKKENDEI